MDIDILENYREKRLIYKQNHPRLPLLIWNYTPLCQYERKWDSITKICRGLITDLEGKIVGKPFPKFFNYEEKQHVPTDKWQVYEKVDGSLGIIINYEGEIVIATRGSFTSDQAKYAKELFDDTCCGINTYNMEIKPGWTYLTEIIYPANRVVVSYADEKLVLLGAYNENLEEVEYENLPDWPYKVECYGQADFLELKKQDLENAEGYVVKFSNGDRCKIKFDTYLRLHRVMTCCSTRSIYDCLRANKNLEEILNGVPDEFYTKIKEYADYLQKSYNDLNQRAKETYYAIENISSRKKFAEQAQTTDISDILFRMKDGREYSSLIWKRLEPTYEKL